MTLRCFGNTVGSLGKREPVPGRSLQLTAAFFQDKCATSLPPPLPTFRGTQRFSFGSHSTPRLYLRSSFTFSFPLIMRFWG